MISDREPGYLGRLPHHDHDRAEAVLQALGLRPTAWHDTDLLAAFTLRAGAISIGAYPGATILCGYPALSGCVEDAQRPFLQRILSVAGEATTLVFEVAGGVNYFAYALYVNAQRMRALAGDAARGVAISEGDLQPEEIAVLGPSERTGVKQLRVAAGEGLTFAMAGRFLGTPFDRFPAESLEMEFVSLYGPGLLRRAIGRLPWF